MCFDWRNYSCYCFNNPSSLSRSKGQFEGQSEKNSFFKKIQFGIFQKSLEIAEISAFDIRNFKRMLH